MAIACLRLFTFFPLRPLFSVPRLRLRIAPSTFFDAPLEYLRAIPLLRQRLSGSQRGGTPRVPPAGRARRRLSSACGLRLIAEEAVTGRGIETGVIPPHAD